MNEQAKTMIENQIKRAQGSKGYFPRQTFYEAKGMNDMALNLKAITIDEYMDFNNRIVALGINNPEYFD